MKQPKPLRIRAILGISLSSLSMGVVAGGPITASVSYAPYVPSSVPMLSGTLLGALSLLISVIMFRMMRHQGAKNGFQIIVPFVVLLVSGGFGANLIKEAFAIFLQNTFSLSNPSGATTPNQVGLYALAPTGNYSKVINISGVTQRITTISANSTYYVVDPPAPITPSCLPYGLLSNGEFCYIAFQ